MAQVSGLRSMESNHKPKIVLRCKLIVLGDAAVGKTSLVETVIPEFNVAEVPIPDTNVIVEFYIFNCPGQSIFNQLDMGTKYYDDAAAVMLVFDIANKESFSHLSHWLEKVRSSRVSSGPLASVLVGNKGDLRNDIDGRAEVSISEASQTAMELGMSYFEASSLMGQGVEEPFKRLAQDYYEKYESTASKQGGMGGIMEQRK